MLLVGCALAACSAAAAWAACLTQPMMQGQDPAVVFEDGFFHLVQSDGCNIRLRRATTFRGLASSANPVIYSPGCSEVWAPEIHRWDDRWYVYYTLNTNPDTGGRDRRGFVAESSGDDPYGPYLDRGVLFDEYWNIDGSVFEWNDRLYYLFSGEPIPGRQEIYIAPMSNPYTLSGPPVLLSTPTEPWETVGNPDVNEGPWGFERDGNLFIVYSASGCWTDDYTLGLLTRTGRGLLSADSWTKSGPAFSRQPGAYGPGHNSVVQDAHGQWWNIYHANNAPGQGCAGLRRIRAQRIFWTPSGMPDFGAPVPAGSIVNDHPDFLAAHVRLAEGRGSSALISPCGNAGTVEGGAAWTSPGLAFNGVDGYVDCGPALGNDVQHTLTLAAWVRPQAFTDWAGIMTKGTTVSPYAMQTWGDGSLRFTANWGAPPGAVGEGSWNSAFKLTPYVWQHVAVTYDGNYVRFYLNGAPDDRPPQATLRCGVIFESLVIGADFPGDDEFFHGAIFDARLYGRALDPAEIQSLANDSPIQHPIPSLSNPTVDGSTFSFDVSGGYAAEYQIWSSGDLHQWSQESVTNPPTVPFHVVLPDATTLPQRYYRIQVE